VVREHLKAFLEHLRLNENASAHTVRAYESDLSQYLVFLSSHLARRVSGLTLADLDHLNARAFLGDRNKRGNSKASAARKLSAIRAFGRYLRREGVLEGDPAALVGTPKREQRIPNHLAVDEMSTLLDAPDTSSALGRRDKSILELFYASGLRLSELVGLDLDDVNLSGRVVRVLGKGRKERIVPFNSKAADAIRAWLKDREGLWQAGSSHLRQGHGGPPKRSAGRGLQPRRTREPLFLNYRGGRLSTRSVDKLVRRYVAECSTRYGISPHALRPSFAPHLLGARAYLRAIPELLGHARLSTTQRYTHVNAAQLIDTYARPTPKPKSQSPNRVSSPSKPNPGVPCAGRRSCSLLGAPRDRARRAQRGRRFHPNRRAAAAPCALTDAERRELDAWLRDMRKWRRRQALAQRAGPIRSDA
jgi:integrase/recombinase XerC